MSDKNTNYLKTTGKSAPTDAVQRGYENLANAIIKDASEEYVGLRTVIIENSQNKGAIWKLDSIIKFFTSQFYEVLTDVDPYWLMHELDKVAEEQIKLKKKKTLIGEKKDAEEMCSM